jgi:hypothetical protein
MENAQTRGRATLTLLQAPLGTDADYQQVLREIEATISSSPGYRAIASGPLSNRNYIAYEFRFLHIAGGESLYTRLVVYYSRDLAYLLTLISPAERLADNEPDFETLLDGLSISKPREELTPFRGTSAMPSLREIIRNDSNPIIFPDPRRATL